MYINTCVYRFIHAVHVFLYLYTCTYIYISGIIRVCVWNIWICSAHTTCINSESEMKFLSIPLQAIGEASQLL